MAGGILCGLAYQWLVIRKNRLGDAMTAHAITNFLLGRLGGVERRAWRFFGKSALFRKRSALTVIRSRSILNLRILSSKLKV